MTTSTPYRQIRAHYDEEIITVYQAYSAEIGDAAVAKQLLSASPAYSNDRMTWIKPSWAWMCYRAGYSYKDVRQARILALSMKHEHFIELLRHGFVRHGAATSEKEVVRVQWDPERSPSLERLPYRSIQIGIPRDLNKQWVDEWVVKIENVTERAQELKKTIDQQPHVMTEELIELGLVPVERPYELPKDIRAVLKMHDAEHCDEGKT
jgi:hypothetical protein